MVKIGLGNLQNHIIAIAVLTILSGIVIVLQFKNLNSRLYRLEKSVNVLSQEWTTQQLQQEQQQNNPSVNPPGESQDQHLEQLQNEYQEYKFQSETQEEESEEQLNDTEQETNDEKNNNTVDQEQDQEQDQEVETEVETTLETEANSETLTPAGQAALERLQENKEEVQKGSLEITNDELDEIENLTPEIDINTYTVSKLKELIKEKGGSIPRKVVKSELVNIYQELR